MDRRTFLLSSLAAVLGGALLSACGGGQDATGGDGGNGSCDDGAGVSFNNTPHAHTTLSLSASQIQAAVPGAYTLLGGAHFHTFTLTASDFTNLQAGLSVSKVDNEGDFHTITIQC